MKFLKDHLYDIIRIYINQIGITILAFILSTAVDQPGKTTLSSILLLVVSIFTILFYFVLLYTMGWDWGANDIIRIESGKQQRTPLKGMLLGLCANVINFALAAACIITMIITMNGNKTSEPFHDVFNLLLRFTNAMYIGIVKWMFLGFEGDLYLSYLLQSIAYFFFPFLSIGVTQLGYFLGLKNFKVFGSRKKA